MDMGGVTRRRRWVIAGALAGLATMNMLAAPAASAHAILQSSTPSSGALLRPGTEPATVELRFDEPVEASLGAIQVVDGYGSRADTARITHPEGAGERVSVGLRAGMAEGSYLVVWRVVSADSHPVHGSFTFAIGHPGVLAAAPSANVAKPLALTLGAARFAGYAGLLLLVGVLAFLIGCQPSLWAAPAVRRLLVAGLGVTALATVAGFALQAAFDVGGSWSRAVDPATLSALLATRLGHAHLLRLVLLVALGLTVWRPRAVSRLFRLAVGVLVVGILATVAVEGHSGRTPVAAALDVAHLAAAGSWLGGLVVLVVVVLPAHRHAAARVAEGLLAPASGPDLPAADGSVAVLERVHVESVSWVSVRRFSVLALVSVAVLSATGVVQALRQVPEWGALSGTSYGRLLMVKLALVAATLAVATVSRCVVHARLRRSSDARRLRLLGRSVAAETVLLVTALLVTSALVASTPAAAAYRPAQERSVHAGPVTLDITAVAPAARTMDVHLYAYGTGGLPADVQQITAEAAQPANKGGLGAVTIPLLQAGTGHYLASRLVLPSTGKWTLTLVVRIGEFDAYTATTTLTVR
jgi:copper transport protein